jgi:hypothetical protein
MTLSCLVYHGARHRRFVAALGAPDTVARLSLLKGNLIQDRSFTLKTNYWDRFDAQTILKERINSQLPVLPMGLVNVGNLVEFWAGWVNPAGKVNPEKSRTDMFLLDSNCACGRLPPFQSQRLCGVCFRNDSNSPMD